MKRYSEYIQRGQKPNSKTQNVALLREDFTAWHLRNMRKLATQRDRQSRRNWSDTNKKGSRADDTRHRRGCWIQSR